MRIMTANMRLTFFWFRKAMCWAALKGRAAKSVKGHSLYRGKTYGTAFERFLPPQGEILKSIIAVAFGEVLRKLRTEVNLTQEQLGLEADLQRKYISSLELGEKAPSLETVFKVSAGLGMNAEKIVTLVRQEIERRESQ